MNTRSKEIVDALIADRANWRLEGKGKAARPVSLKLDAVMGAYWNIVFGNWVQDVYLDFFYRAHVILRALKSGHPDFTDLEYVKSHFSVALVDGIDTLYLDCDECTFELQTRLSSGFNRWWFEQHPDWKIAEHDELKSYILENAKPPGDRQLGFFD